MYNTFLCIVGIKYTSRLRSHLVSVVCIIIFIPFLLQVVEVVDSYTLTPSDALHIRANENYTDQFGKQRSIGSEWLVTLKDTESYIPDITEVGAGSVCFHTYIVLVLF